jgi:Kef-type K+ transport system membrane component KefB
MSSIVFSIFLIFTGAALFSTLALWTRQSLLVAYMLLGAILGPFGLSLLGEADQIMQIGDIGIIFLLFLLGLNLHPQNLWHMLKKATLLALVSSLLFAGIGFAVAYGFGFSMIDCLVIAAAMMFSSTIVGLKLLPTSTLHHQHKGEVMISVLLMQDIIAIIVLLVLNDVVSSDALSLHNILELVLGLPGLIVFAFLLERYILVPLLLKFDQIKEYVFLLAIGWCLGLAELAQVAGVSHEIGAFIAGVALAASPIALFIAESLKPLRDFFLVLFFFSIGASFDYHFLMKIGLPAVVLAMLMLSIKPGVFAGLLKRGGEKHEVAWEVGVRLGQCSEFSLLLAYIALMTPGLVSLNASYLIQATTIMTFVVSSYWVTMKYPTPLGFSEKMRRD